jgi:hypothetical protein
LQQLNRPEWCKWLSRPSVVAGRLGFESPPFIGQSALFYMGE